MEFTLTRASPSHRLEPLRHVDAGVLNIAYHEAGPADGPVVMLLHGFPFDIHAYVDVVPLLAAKGCRTIVPYLRGYGATRFRDPTTPRSGEQAAIGADLIALMDSLHIDRFTVVEDESYFDRLAKEINLPDDMKREIAKLPAGLLDLLRIPGLGPKRVKLLYSKLKIKSAADLAKARPDCCFCVMRLR